MFNLKPELTRVTATVTVWSGGLRLRARARCCGRRKYFEIEIFVTVLRTLVGKRNVSVLIFWFFKYFQRNCYFITISSEREFDYLLFTPYNHTIGLKSLWVINCLTKGQKTNITMSQSKMIGVTDANGYEFSYS